MIVLVTGLIGLAAAIIGLLLELNKDVAEVHVLVNARMHEALDRIDQLHAALIAAGVEVPGHTERRDP